MIQEVNGQSCLVQAEGSAVSLQVPERVHGTITGRTHTDNSKFLHLIKDNECLVTPGCEINLEGKSNQDDSNKNFKVKIPHIIKNVEKAKKYIRVRNRNIHSKATTTVGFKRKRKPSGPLFLKKRKDFLDGDAW